MLTVLFCLCIAFINSARGSGIHHMKFPELIAIGICAYAIHPYWWYSALAILPMATMFAVGTGELIAIFTRTFIKEWRIWESIIPFIYYMIFFNL